MPYVYDKPTELLPIACWVAEGDTGRLMCLDCKNEAGCHGCPVAFRERNGITEYYRTPAHGYVRA